MGKFLSKPLHFYLFFLAAYVAFLFWLPSGYDKYFWMTWANYDWFIVHPKFIATIFITALSLAFWELIRFIPTEF